MGAFGDWMPRNCADMEDVFISSAVNMDAFRNAMICLFVRHACCV